MFQVVSNFYNRTIITSITLDEFIESMKKPDFLKKSQVDMARKVYKESPLKKEDPLYKSIKSSLPCITFLNTFKDYVNKDNIIRTNGFIYFDVDGINYFDFSKFDFIVASWKSLSNDGYGVLIKCSNLSDDLLENVVEMSEVLGITLDKQASSKDRLNVMGYDTEIYYNPNYKEYKFNSNKKVSFNNIIKSSNRLVLNDTKNLQDISEIRFSNLKEIEDNYDFKGMDYAVLENKIEYAEVFIPKNIFEGNRNKSMFIICSQIRGLNTWISHDSLFRVCSVINEDKFKPKLSLIELNEIVRKVFENKNPLVMLNKTRRILYNPKSNLTKKQKKDISVKEMAKFRKTPNDLKIVNCIENWDFNSDGKITLCKISKKTKLGIATIKRRGKEIKDNIQKLNKKYLCN